MTNSLGSSTVRAGISSNAVLRPVDPALERVELKLHRIANQYLFRSVRESECGRLQVDRFSARTLSIQRRWRLVVMNPTREGWLVGTWKAAQKSLEKASRRAAGRA